MEALKDILLQKIRKYKDTFTTAKSVDDVRVYVWQFLKERLSEQEMEKLEYQVEQDTKDPRHIVIIAQNEFTKQVLGV